MVHRKSRATIKDIALRTGVSANTVSRTLRGLPHIHPETRHRVLAAAKELNYKRNMLARSLVLRRTESIGVVITDTANPNYSRIIRGIEDYLFEHNINIMVSSSTGDEERERSVVDLFLGRAVDGVIMTPTMKSYQTIEEIVRRHVPVVLTNRHFTGHPHDAVRVDNYHSLRRMTEYLIGLGHRNIVFFGGHAFVSSCVDRYKGHTAAMKAAGLRPRPAVFCGTAREGNAPAALDRLLQTRQRPTALLCYNDDLAVEVMHHLMETGHDVPGEISITGFDDIDMAALLRTPLTTVLQPTYVIGQKAAELLLRRINGSTEGYPHEVLLDTELIIRASTAPPPARAKAKAS